MPVPPSPRAQTSFPGRSVFGDERIHLSHAGEINGGRFAGRESTTPEYAPVTSTLLAESKAMPTPPSRPTDPIPKVHTRLPLVSELDDVDVATFALAGREVCGRVENTRVV